MQVRRSGVTASADDPEGLTLFQGLALPNGYLSKMGVAGQPAVAVPEENHAAVSATVSHLGHHPIRRRQNRIPAPARLQEVDPRVELPAPGPVGRQDPNLRQGKGESRRGVKNAGGTDDRLGNGDVWKGEVCTDRRRLG
jgi:hypothetical protein